MSDRVVVAGCVRGVGVIFAGTGAFAAGVLTDDDRREQLRPEAELAHEDDGDESPPRYPRAR